MQSARQNLSLEVAVLASLLLHAMTFGAWQYRQALAGFPLFSPIAKVLSAAFAPPRYAPPKPAPQTITFVEVPAPTPAPPPPEPPRQFMETDKTQEAGEQPKDAQYYSDRSTAAANPANPTGKTGETPYLNGKETRVMSTEDVVPDLGAPSAPSPPRAPPSAAPAMPSAAANPTPAQPAPSLPASTPVPPPPKDIADKGLNAAEEKKLEMIPGDMALAPRPVPVQLSPTGSGEPGPVAPPEPAPASAGGSSPRVIAARKAHLVAAGVSRIGIAAFNVEDSPFGAYDKQLIHAVQSRWYALIEQNQLYERAGEVTLHFQLMQDGTVQAMEIKDNTAGQILALFCEKAVLESAPFEPLPEKLRALVGNEPREVNFTFYY